MIPRLPPPLVLVVDDDRALGEYLSQLFSEEGFRVIVATDGRACLDMAARYLPNLITMDLMMPGMDGRAAIRCLRKNPFTRHIPVMVVSALSEQEGTGADAAMVKPINEETLLDTVNGLLKERDVSRSCIVLGDKDQYQYDESFTVMCPGNIVYCSPEKIWSHIEKGFQGTVFVPADLAQDVDLDTLSRESGVQVVILPAGPG